MQLKNSSGFTLVEVMVVVVIVALMAAGGFAALSSGEASWFTAEASIQVQENLRKSLDRMTAELRESKFSQVTVTAGAGFSGTDVVKFSIPVICHTGDNLLDSSGDVAHWGATTIWSCRTAACMDADNLCATVDYKYIQYEVISGNTLVRKVLNNAGTSVRQDNLAFNIVDFDVLMPGATSPITLTVKTQVKSNLNRQISATVINNVVFEINEKAVASMKIKILNRCKNEKGMALVMVLLVVMVFAILGSVFIARTVNEKNTAEREKLLNQAYYVAEAGGDAALAKLDELINTDLLNTVNMGNPNVVGAKAGQYAGNNDGLGFLITYVKNGGIAQFVQSGTQLLYNSASINFGAGTYQYKIILTQKTNPVTVFTDTWDFPYYYQINSTSTVNGQIRKVRLDGDLTVRVQRDNFAKYALFTDHHGLPSGDTVWFTSKTDFAGPLHTNERYSFAFNPSGVFDGAVTQHHNSARFYNNGFPFLADASSNGTVDVPTFNSTFTRGVAEIVLSSTVQQQDLYDEAKGTLSGNSAGIFLPNAAGNLTGGIYAKGNTDVVLGVDGSGNAQYTLTQGGTTKVITVNRATNQTSITSGSTTLTYTGLPEGVDGLGTILYVDGTISKLEGTVQKDTELTVSAQTDINITNNIRYQEYTPAVGTPGAPGYQPPNADGKTNLLGILAWGGNVNVTTGAPNNIEMHGIVMARNGIFQVNNYSDAGVGSRGVATLLGGVITQFYGAFGLSDATTGAPMSGFGRNFAYDQRTLMGKSPPYFPSMKTFIAFTNDLTDKVAFEEGGF